MIEHTFEISYNNPNNFFRFVTKNKIDATYLMYKLMKSKGINKNLIEFKEDEKVKEFTRDNVVEMIRLINCNAITQYNSFVNIDKLVDSFLQDE